MYRNNDISKTEEIIDKLLKEYTKGVQNNFEIDIVGTGFNAQLSEEEFKQLLELITPYSKSNIELVQRALTDDMKDYINYIVCNEDSLSSKELERLNILKNL